MTALVPPKKLTLLYEDAYLVAVDKPAGMLVHAGRDPEGPEWIVMKVLRDQLEQRVYTIHRLDRPTSGVLLYARDVDTETGMRKLFEQQKIHKRYLAIVRGEVPSYWECHEPLQKSEGEKWRPASTRFRCLQIHPSKEYSLIEAEPKSGRHHQIRKHLAHSGHPIIGDYLHGSIAFNEDFSAAHGVSRLLLLAQSVDFQHPITGSPIIVEAPQPEEFTTLFNPGDMPQA